MYQISIDPATHSIAIVVFKDSQLKQIISSDLFPHNHNKQIKDIDRIDAVKRFIDFNLEEYLHHSPIILIEKQISGTPTYIIFISLITLFREKGIKEINIVSPTLKNQLDIENHNISTFYNKYTNTYKANKEHSRAIFKSKTKDINIKYNKKHECDIADCYTQFLAWLGN